MTQNSHDRNLSRSAILAVDPGLMTGWAHGIKYAGNDFVTVLQTGQAEFEQFMRLAERLADEGLDGIVIERYTITAETLRKSRQTTALELIGCCRWLSMRYDLEFVLQSPGDAKSFATDDKLEKAGWMVKKADDHANDALRHLLLYSVKNRLMEVPR